VKSGIFSLQTSITNGQRGWKGQPPGRFESDGGLPGTLSRKVLSPNFGKELIK